MAAPSTDATIKVMTGNEACAEGALAAGLRFFAGYPITPSSEIAEELSAKLPRAGMDVESSAGEPDSPRSSDRWAELTRVPLPAASA